jgi:hypothetical protein
MLCSFLKESKIKSLVLSNVITKCKNIEKILKADSDKLVLEKIRISGVDLCVISSKPELYEKGIQYNLE